MTATEAVFVIMVVLSFLEAQVALILATLAFLRNRPERVSWEPSEEDQREADLREAERIKREVELQGQGPKTFTEFARVFDRISG